MPIPRTGKGMGPEVPLFLQPPRSADRQDSGDTAAQQRQKALIRELDQNIGKHSIAFSDCINAGINADNEDLARELSAKVIGLSKLFLRKNLEKDYSPEEIESAIYTKLDQLEKDPAHTALSRQLYGNILERLLDNLDDGLKSQSRRATAQLSLPVATYFTSSNNGTPDRQSMQGLSQIASNVIEANEKKFILNAIESIYDIASSKEIYAYARNGEPAEYNLLAVILPKLLRNYENEQNTWDDFKNSNPTNQEIKKHYKDLMQSIGECFAIDRHIRHPMKREIDENESRVLQTALHWTDQIGSSARLVLERVTGKFNPDEREYKTFSQLRDMRGLGLENPESLFLRKDFLNEFRQSRIELLTDPGSLAEAQVHEIMKEIFNL
jgi:hypothetical protein